MGVLITSLYKRISVLPFSQKLKIIQFLYVLASVFPDGTRYDGSYASGDLNGPGRVTQAGGSLAVEGHFHRGCLEDCWAVTTRRAQDQEVSGAGQPEKRQNEERLRFSALMAYSF